MLIFSFYTSPTDQTYPLAECAHPPQDIQYQIRILRASFPPCLVHIHSLHPPDMRQEWHRHPEHQHPAECDPLPPGQPLFEHLSRLAPMTLSRKDLLLHQALGVRVLEHILRRCIGLGAKVRQSVVTLAHEPALPISPRFGATCSCCSRRHTCLCAGTARRSRRGGGPGSRCCRHQCSLQPKTNLQVRRGQGKGKERRGQQFYEGRGQPLPLRRGSYSTSVPRHPASKVDLQMRNVIRRP